MRVLVCGGRHYRNVKVIRFELDTFHGLRPISLLVHGDASGADTLADLWAERRGIIRVKCPANWKGFGRSAGYRRNRFMLDTFHPEWIIAFPGGEGTKGMVFLARDAGIKVHQVTERNATHDDADGLAVRAAAADELRTDRR